MQRRFLPVIAVPLLSLWGVPPTHARSLNPGVDRLAFSVVWDMDEEGNIQ